MNIKKYYEGAIKPFTLLDKEVLRWYTKHANNLEKKAKIINEIFTNNKTLKANLETESFIPDQIPLGKAIDNLLEEYKKKHEQNYEINFIPQIM
jgi:hypothetical protein